MPLINVLIHLVTPSYFEVVTHSYFEVHALCEYSYSIVFPEDTTYVHRGMCVEVGLNAMDL